MAKRRMFSLDVIDTDHFLEMSSSAQSLYFHLGMRADDDGFVSSPKKITRAINCNEDDLELLKNEGYIIPFENGVIVITHWKQHNHIQKDRYNSTVYHKEKEKLCEENGIYKMYPKCIQDVSKMETQVRIGKDRLGEEREEKDSCSYGDDNNDDDTSSFVYLEDFFEQAKSIYINCLKKIYRTVPPDRKFLKEHCEMLGIDDEKFYDYYQANGWMIGNKKIYDWSSVVRSWMRRDDMYIPEHEDIDMIITDEVRLFRMDVMDNSHLYKGKMLQEAVEYWIHRRRYEDDADNAIDRFKRLLSFNWDAIAEDARIKTSNYLEAHGEELSEEEYEEYENFASEISEYACGIKTIKENILNG